MKNHRRDSDPCPNLFFSEEDGFRYLHFGSPWIQGAMRVGRPYDLVLEYPRQMMACALFYPEPEQIVQLGLGAASLTKFCWKHTRAKIVMPKNLSARDVTSIPLNGFRLISMMRMPRGLFTMMWTFTSFAGERWIRRDRSQALTFLAALLRKAFARLTKPLSSARL